MSKVDPSTVKHMYLIERKGITQIAEFYGVTKEAISYHLERMGIKPGLYEGRQPTSDKNEALRGRAIQLRADGMSTHDIANALKIPETTVRRLLK